MTAFDQNKLLEERAFSGLNWGYFMKGKLAKEGRLLPFIFLYQGDKKIKTINFQEGEDNFEVAMNILAKSEEDFDQFVIGYQAQMLLDDTKEPKDVIICKAFDRSQEYGAFLVQKYELSKDSTIGIIRKGNPQYLDNLPMPLPSVETAQLKSVEEVGSNAIHIKNKKDNSKIDLSLLLRHNTESELYFTFKDCLERWINSFSAENYSGILEVNIGETQDIQTNFLSFLLKDALQDFYTSEKVKSEFTRNGIGLSVKVTYGYNYIVLVEDSTQDVIGEINDLRNIMANVPSEKAESKDKLKNKWWEFWK